MSKSLIPSYKPFTNAERRRADQVIRKNRGLAHHFAKTWNSPIRDCRAKDGAFQQGEEFLTSAMLGIAEASRTWKPEQGKLSTWSVSPALHCLFRAADSLKDKFPTVSLDSVKNQDKEGPLIDNLAAEPEEDPLYQTDREAAVIALLRGLNSKQRAAVTQRYLDGLGYENIGANLHVSKQRAAQLVEEGLNAMREAAPSYVRDLT